MELDQTLLMTLKQKVLNGTVAKDRSHAYTFK